MKYREFLEKYLIRFREDDWQDDIRLDDDIDSLKIKVKYNINGLVQEIMFCDIPSRVGFKYEFNVKNKYHVASGMWSDKNNLSPEEVFYLENRVILLTYKGKFRAFNLSKDKEKILRLNDIPCFKNLEKFKIILNGLYTEKHSSRIESRYISLLKYLQDNGEYFKVGVDVYSIFTDKLLSKYCEEHKTSSYEEYRIIRSDLLKILRLLEIDVNFPDEKLYTARKIVHPQYYFKEEILEMMDKLGTDEDALVRKLVLYAHFLGMAENKAEGLRNLKMKNIDIEKKTAKTIVNDEERYFEVDDLFINLCKRVNSLDGKKVEFRNSLRHYRFEMSSEYILKTNRDVRTNYGMNPWSKRAMYDCLTSMPKTIFKGGAKKFNDVYISGVLYRMYKDKIKNGTYWCYDEMATNPICRGASSQYNLNAYIDMYESM